MALSIFDNHCHMDARNASDYEAMALSGIDRVLVPCSFTGEPKCDPRGFAARFERIIGMERQRACQFGVELVAGLSVHPCDLGDEAIVDEALEELERRLGGSCVVGIGELTLRGGHPAAERLFDEQLRLADGHGLPAIIEACPDPLEYRRLIDRLGGLIAAGRAVADRIALIDVDAEKLERAWPLGLARYGVAVSPRQDGPFVLHRKLDHREVAALVERHGADRIMLNSGLHFGNSDPLGLPKVLLRLRLMGMDEPTLVRLAHDNAASFYLRG